ncbi:MAG: DUF1318 domain-containing protein [Desulfatiglans sp.]|jgi:hypothetical protein|nr:DUF1318 domain-containing protein [Desulfatiglans sp.]
MKHGLTRAWMFVLFPLMFVIACVTVNIYFPAEKVESVAEEIVDEIRGNSQEERENPQKNDETSLFRKTLWALSVSPAWADEVTEASNPVIRALKEKMKARYIKMKPYYKMSALKENDNGYVSLENIQGLGLKEKRMLKTLVHGENKDRKNLYTEVAKALKIQPGEIDKIAKVFAEKWQKPVR